MTPLVLAVAAVLAVSFSCSVAEAAFLSVTQSYIGLLQSRKRRSGSLLARQKRDVDRTIAAILTLNTVANTAGASVVGAMALRILGNEWIALFSGIFTVAVLLVSEIVPKTIGATHWKTLAPFLAYPVAALVAVLAPVLFVTGLVSRLFAPKGEQQTVSRAELEILAEIGQREGTIAEDEYKMVSRVVRLDRVSAREAMTPRTKIVAAPETATLEDLEKLILSSNHGRIPIYRGSIDQIVAVASERDVWRAIREGGKTLADVCRPPKFVPGSKPIEELTAEMRRERAQVAIVADEYGGTAGLVTVSDLIEEVVGEFHDEHENAENDFQTIQDGWLAAGHLPLHLVAERLGIELPEDDYDTVGGFVFGELGRLPVIDDEVFWGKARFRVIGMDGRRIARLAIRIAPEEPEEDGE